MRQLFCMHSRPNNWLHNCPGSNTNTTIAIHDPWRWTGDVEHRLDAADQRWMLPPVDHFSLFFSVLGSWDKVPAAGLYIPLPTSGKAYLAACRLSAVYKAGWPNGKALDYESRDCRFDPCVGHFFS